MTFAKGQQIWGEDPRVLMPEMKREQGFASMVFYDCREREKWELLLMKRNVITYMFVLSNLFCQPLQTGKDLFENKAATRLSLKFGTFMK